MTHESRSPANGRALTGLRTVVGFGGNRQSKVIPTSTKPQAGWTEARAFEQQSIARAREALTLRGPDRLLALSLASTFALAARDNALIAGATR